MTLKRKLRRIRANVKDTMKDSNIKTTASEDLRPDEIDMEEDDTDPELGDDD